MYGTLYEHPMRWPCIFTKTRFSRDQRVCIEPVVSGFAQFDIWVLYFTKTGF